MAIGMMMVMMMCTVMMAPKKAAGKAEAKEKKQQAKKNDEKADAKRKLELEPDAKLSQEERTSLQKKIASALTYEPKNETETEKANREKAKDDYTMATTQEAKDHILKKFFVDPKFKWISTASEEIRETTKTSAKDLKDWFTAAEIMNLHKVPTTDPDYSAMKDAIISDLDSRDHIEPAWAKLGIKQYFYFFKGKNTIANSTANSSIANSSAAGPKARLNDLFGIGEGNCNINMCLCGFDVLLLFGNISKLAGSSSSSGDAKIQIINPNLMALREVSNVLASAEKKLGAMVTDMKKNIVILKAAVAKDISLEPTLKKLEELMKDVDSHYNDLMAASFQVDGYNDEENAPTLTESVRLLNVVAEAHAEGWAKYKKRVLAMLETA